MEKNKRLKEIKKINSGGIMPCYMCPAACRHCLYGCSNKMGGQYITKEQCKNLCKDLQKKSVTSMHIGGGEPFLNFDMLCYLIKTMKEYNIEVEYIETNAAWVSDNFSDEDLIEKLKYINKIGGNCLLISVDPYHIEFVELKKPIRLINLCKKANIDFFVWQNQYLNEFLGNEKIQLDRKYTRQELENILGEKYVLNTANSYGLTYNGRALNIAREYMENESYEKYLSESPCACLSSTNHCHVDLNGYFIPVSCTGIGVLISDLEHIKEDKYPIYYALSVHGVKGLFEYAASYGFYPNEDGYVNKCDFCFNIRKFMIGKKLSADIYPLDYYSSDF